MAKNPVQSYQIKVTLRGTHPAIWRRILIPSNTTLLKLHDIIQIVMSWEHELGVEKILLGQEHLRTPICLKGKRACPPEDVGGVWGYENFLKAIHDPKHEEHDDFLTWIGGEFDPEAFDLEEVNDRLQRMGRGW